MKELLGLVGMTKEDEKGDVTFEADLDSTRQEVAQTVEKTLFQDSSVEITVEPKVEARKEPRVATRVEPQPEPKAEQPKVEMEPRPEPQPARGGFFGIGRSVTPPPSPASVAEPRPEPMFTGEDDEDAVRAPFIRPNATVIAAGATFFGDLRAEGDVEVLGKLKGNLEATGNVRITGKVLGDVKGAAVVLAGCAVQGNITSTSSVSLDASAVVVGDVLATDIESDGKIKGNLQIARAATFFPGSVLAGNVTACTIAMNQGARIQGAMRIAEDPETNALFGDGLEI